MRLPMPSWPARYELWGVAIIKVLGSGPPTVTTRLAGAARGVRDRETGLRLDDPEDVSALAEGIRWALSDAPAHLSATGASVRDYEWADLVAPMPRCSSGRRAADAQALT
jgi:glycosyltransferase involved in cell wall biosynthesis